MGMHPRARGARHGCLRRNDPSRRILCVRLHRRAAARNARPASERSRQHRAPEARRRPGRDSAPVDPPERRVRRSSAVVAAERRLGGTLDLHGPPGPLTKPLSAAARSYVTAVIVAGAAVFAVCVPLARFDQPVLFGVLLVLSSATAALKVQLPLLTSSSTMSVSYAVDFAALLLIGPHTTMIVAAASAWCQCHLNTRPRTPLHRTVFSMATPVMAVDAAGLAFRLLRGAGP